MIDNLLKKFNLSPKETAVYKLVLEHGKIFPAMIGRLAKINRTTVYSVAKELMQKGLILEDTSSKVLYYLPARERDLDRVIENEKRKVREQEDTIRELQQYLKSVPESRNFSIPKVRYIEESGIEEYLQEASSRWNESVLTTDSTWWGFQDHTFVEKYGKWIQWYWRHAPQKVRLNLFSNDRDSEHQFATDSNINRRNIRFWGNNEFTATQWIVGAYIILIVTKQHPYSLVEIHDSVMAYNVREVYKKLWHDYSA